jgi:hypothetical protein
MRDVGNVGAGPAGLFAANVLVRAGIDCVVFERLAEGAVRARARGLIEHRTAGQLERHGLADGMLARGKTIGACEFRRNGRRYVFDYAALSGAAHHVYPQLLVGDLIDALRPADGEIQFGVAAESVRLADEPVIVTGGGEVRCAKPDAIINIGELEPAVQARLGNPEVLRDLRQRCLALAGDRDHIPAELQEKRLRHGKHPSSEDEVLTGKESTELGAVPGGAGLVLVGRRHAMIARGGDPLLLACVATAMAGATG